VRGFSLSASGFTAETDCLLEEGGFEPLVPLAHKNGNAAGERDEQIAMSPPIDKQSLERLVTGHTAQVPREALCSPADAE
jgi:hypothetical protein